MISPKLAELQPKSSAQNSANSSPTPAQQKHWKKRLSPNLAQLQPSKNIGKKGLAQKWTESSPRQAQLKHWKKWVSPLIHTLGNIILFSGVNEDCRGECAPVTWRILFTVLRQSVVHMQVKNNNTQNALESPLHPFHPRDGLDMRRSTWKCPILATCACNSTSTRSY